MQACLRSSSLLVLWVLLPLLRCRGEGVPSCSCVPDALCRGAFYARAEGGCDPGETCCARREESGLASCGFYSEEALGARLGGRRTLPGELPWMVALTRSKDGSFLGSGALIHRGVVLTAAHLVEGLSGDELTARVGAHQLGGDEGGEERRVLAILPHAEFDSLLLGWDAALLVLREPVSAPALCLPRQSFEGRLCIFAGWSNTSRASRVEKSRQLVVPREQCQETLRSSPQVAPPWLHLHPTLLCTVPHPSRPKQRPCKGEGGGPLFCRVSGEEADSTTGHYALAGLAVAAPDCLPGGAPTLFTDVARLAHWLDDQLGRLHDGVAHLQL